MYSLILFLSMNLNETSLLYPCHTPQWHSVSRLKAIVLVAGGRGWARAADFRQNYACSSRELRKLWKAPALRRYAVSMPHTTMRCHQSLRFLAAANWVRVRHCDLILLHNIRKIPGTFSQRNCDCGKTTTTTLPNTYMILVIQWNFKHLHFFQPIIEERISSKFKSVT